MRRRRTLCRFLAIIYILAGPQSFAFDVAFSDVAQTQGINYTGVSFGASWGDYDRDGQPDLFLGNHWSQSSIYHNTGMGFVDIGPSLGSVLTGDLHVGSWGDYDNDGDQDLAISVGAVFGTGSDNNRILQRTNTGFVDVAASLGLEFGEGRGRSPLWFDWDNDSKLDLLFVNVPRPDDIAPTTLFTQTPLNFVNANATVGLATNGATNFATLFSTGPDAQAQLLIHSVNPFPGEIYDFSSVPFVSSQATLGLTGIPFGIYDVASGDFDNDMQTELYLTRITDPMTVRAITDHQLRAFLRGDPEENFGFSFSAAGEIEINPGPDWVVSPDDVRIGSTGTQAASLPLTLNSSDSANWGAFAGDPLTPGLFVHYDTTTSLWQIQLRDEKTIAIIVDTDASHSNLQSIGLPGDPSTQIHLYLDQVGGVFVNQTLAAGLNAQRACPVSVAADFDNDMDLDIYLLCSDMVGNLPNQLLENNGSGVFTAVNLAAGAAGAEGGLGDTVALADYDSNGFMDILIANGAGTLPFPLDGPTQLFHNSGNSNHWIELDLFGVVSNTDAVGAMVLVETAGVTQYRLQDGGMHRYAQNHTRLHFGLGTHAIIDRIEIRWPSGIVNVWQNLPADQVLQITEIAGPDTDGDLVPDAQDNCTLTANADQNDTDNDGYGNACDADFDNNCIVNFLDIGSFSVNFQSTNPLYDLDGSGIVNFLDYATVVSSIFQEPGPSAVGPCAP